MERYKEIEALEKPIWNTPMHELLDMPLDGRTRYAKQLPVYIGGTHLLFSAMRKKYAKKQLQEVIANAENSRK